MNDSARQRSDEFLRIADQFKLGDLVTETSHPVTEKLSEVAQEDVAAALKLLFKVDEDVVLKYREMVESCRMTRIADEVLKALQAGGRIFFTGCGSTGRLSILLDSIWRDFWQQTRDQRGGGAQSAEDWEHRTFSVMAGAPELAAGGKGGKLLSEGLYARMRHPRYVAVILGVTAWALFTNYLVMYLLIPLTTIGLLLVASLEERELARRFGDEYADYRRRVPMFVPRFGTDQRV